MNREELQGLLNSIGFAIEKAHPMSENSTLEESMHRYKEVASLLSGMYLHTTVENNDNDCSIKASFTIHDEKNHVTYIQCKITAVVGPFIRITSYVM